MEMRFCPLFSGSSGNAALVEAGRTRILVDAGLPGRTIEGALEQVGVSPRSLSAIVVSHEHTDHIKGVGVLSRKYQLPIYANAACWQAMRPLLGKLDPQNMRVFVTNQDFYLGDLALRPFATYHDSADPVGFRFSFRGQSVCTLTDVGHVDERLLREVQGARVVLLESNHDIAMLQCGPYPQRLKQRILSRHGHLSNDAAAEAAVRLVQTGTQVLLLGHLSAQNNHPDLAYITVSQALAEAGCLEEVQLELARRSGPGAIYEIA